MHLWGFGAWGGLGMVLMAAFWVLVLAGVVYLIRALAAPGRPGGTQTGESPRDLLDRRYARGEITREGYSRLFWTWRGAGELGPPLCPSPVQPPDRPPGRPVVPARSAADARKK